MESNRRRTLLRRTILTPFVNALLASVGILGGIASLFVGFVCVVIHSVVPRDTVFDTVGTVLLIIPIPMILIGSIFLDEIEKHR